MTCLDFAFQYLRFLHLINSFGVMYTDLEPQLHQKIIV